MANFVLSLGTVLPISLALLASSLVYRNRKIIFDKIFAMLFFRMMDCYHGSLDGLKSELFSEIGHFQSLDENLRNRGQIRILEIGVGTGSNFKFYPKNAILIVADPNPFFQKQLLENASKFPELILEKVLLCEGENLREVKDGSVDVVVTTAVLCSVRDENQVLREIKRVLAQGGTYFFLEHGIGEEGSKYRRIQNIVKVIWSLFGCQPTRDHGVMIEQAGFSEISIKHFILPRELYNTIFHYVVAPHVIGTTRK